MLTLYETNMNKSVRNKNLISISGCHGVGKSTILDSVKKNYDCILPPKTIPNPFSENAILSFIHYIIERNKQHQYLNKRRAERIITDRYGFLDTSIYVQSLFECGFISKSEQNLFSRVVNNLADVWITPKLICILCASPEEILNRLKNREKLSKNHFNPFDINLIESINNNFYNTYHSKELPPFLSKELKSKLNNVKFLLVETTNITLNKTIEIIFKEINNVWI